MDGYWKCVLTDKTVFDFGKHAECYEVCEENVEFTAFFKYNKETMEHITIGTVRTDCILATEYVDCDDESCESCDNCKSTVCWGVIDKGYQE